MKVELFDLRNSRIDDSSSSSGHSRKWNHQQNCFLWDQNCGWSRTPVENRREEIFWLSEVWLTISHFIIFDQGYWSFQDGKVMVI